LEDPKDRQSFVKGPDSGPPVTPAIAVQGAYCGQRLSKLATA